MMEEEPKPVLADVLRDEKKFRILFARSIPITDFLTGLVGSSVPCPFHGDSTPSAKIFHDLDGTVRLHCFAEHRQFTSYDYVKHILKQRPSTFLRKKFTEQELEGILRKVVFTITQRPLVVDLETASVQLPDMEKFLAQVYFEHADAKDLPWNRT